MRHDEIWSYEYDRILEYFMENGAAASGSLLRLPGCTVTLQPQPGRKLGDLVLPRTRVIIEGEDSEKVYHAFYLNFLSGGA